MCRYVVLYYLCIYVLCIFQKAPINLPTSNQGIKFKTKNIKFLQICRGCFIKKYITLGYHTFMDSLIKIFKRK